MNEEVVEEPDEAELSLAQKELSPGGAYTTPAADIYETPKQLVILVDLPGVEPENVEIDLKRSSISIRAKVSEQEGGRVLMDEYRAADFFRAFGITELVDYTRVQASLEDGVLKVVLPKAQRMVSRKITVSCE
jgi:HSP20 family protein